MPIKTAKKALNLAQQYDAIVIAFIADIKYC